MSEESKALSSERYEAILPDGWADGDDIFDVASWAGKSGDAQDAEPAADETEKELSLEELFADKEEQAEPVPTTDVEVPPETKKLKFRATVDHEDRDVELDESDLPSLYQKAQALDRYQSKVSAWEPTMQKAERLHKVLGYDTIDEMLDAAGQSYKDAEIQRMRDGGLQDDMADALYEWKAERAAGAKPAEAKPEPAPAPAESKPAERDFRAEAADLMQSEYAGEIRKNGFPNEAVTAAVQKGIPLKAAYIEYRAQKEKAENEALRRENQTLKQNADAARRAPVRRTTRGGSTDSSNSSETDPFLKGFNSDYR